jgi:NAD(P)-dependent dehydrogenase (short-subunit alcohol dehydrogenase family)
MQPTLLITGANRGLGLALTRQFTDQGWRVLACCRAPQKSTELALLARNNRATIHIHQLDVGDNARIRELARALEGEAVDILLNNAGVAGPHQQEFGAVDEAGWLETFRINTIAPLKMAEAFTEHVAASRYRVIATMGSQLGCIGENSSGGRYIYRTTKAAVHMAMKSLSVDLRSRGITAVALHPGWVRTDLGGPQAPIGPAESATGLFRLLTRLTLEDSGKLWTYEGRVLAW